MRALITGITGFAGGFLAEHLLDQGDEILGVASAGQWPADAPATLSRRVELVGWDLSLDNGLGQPARKAIHDFGPQVIYHLAALAVPADCGQNAPNARALATNVEGTRRVVQLAAALRWRPRLLLVSTSQVYAPVTLEHYRVTEDWPLGPTRGYGQSKLAAEKIVREAVDSLRLEAVIARAFQHTGPRQSPRLMLPEWTQQFVAADRPAVRVQRLSAYIDLCDVRDVVRAYRLLVEHGVPGQAYNVGSGVRLRSGEVLQELRRLADPQREIFELCPEPKQDPVADISRLAAATRWQPAIAWQQTVADTLDFWRGRV